MHFLLLVGIFALALISYSNKKETKPNFIQSAKSTKINHQYYHHWSEQPETQDHLLYMKYMYIRKGNDINME